MRRTNAILSGLAAVLSYLAFRFYIYREIVAAGFVPTGVLQYDSFYSFSFAQELIREKRFLFFSNPFGTLDQSPRLFSGLASLLTLAEPWWREHLQLFDISLGALCSALSGGFYGYFTASISRQRILPTLIWTQVSVLGGGLGFFLAWILQSHAMDSHLIYGAFWGLGWLSNSISTWELIYHALFWWGVCALVNKHRGQVLAACIAFLWLHPFTLATYGLWTVIFILFKFVESRRFMNADTVSGIVIGFFVLISVMIYNIILPRYSEDGAFLRSVYERLHYFIPLPVLVVFLLPALIFGLTSWLFRSRNERSSPAMYTSWAAASILILMNLSYLWTDAVVVPAHWLRVYPMALIFAAGLAVPQSPDKLTSRFSLLIGCLLLALSCADNLQTVRVISQALIAGGRPPAILTQAQAHLIRELSTVRRGKVALLRKCESPYAASSDLDFAISALSGQSVGFGHVDFTPDLKNKMSLRTLCGAPRDKVEQLIRENWDLVSEADLTLLVGRKPDTSVGGFHIWRIKKSSFL